MILPLENQVCSLELSKRLKELGVKQDSLFYWWGKMSGSGHPSSPYKEENGFVLLGSSEIVKTCSCLSEFGVEDSSHCFDKKYSAFTVAELFELLPYCVDGDNGDKAYLDVDKTISDYEVAYSELAERCTLGPVNDKNLANCLAELLIKVKENEK